MGVKVFTPQIQVLLIKSQRRSEIAPGINVVQDRYQKLDTVDLTPYLDDYSSVQVTKSVRQPSGTWAIRFSDMKHPELLETIYALVSPMDMIEIRMCHSPKELVNGKPPIVTRGFVSSITRSEAINGNTPQRLVTVTGHDFMKVLQLYRINYKMFTEMEKWNFDTFRFFQYFKGDMEIKNMTGNAFAGAVVSGMINPWMARISALTNIGGGQKAINQWGVRSSIDGNVSAYTPSSYDDSSLYEIMRVVLDVGAWNEMFLVDEETAPTLVIRPAPFKDVKGNFIQGSADERDVSSEDISAKQVTRSDDSVANYFWVPASRASLWGENDQRSLALHGGPELFVRFDYINCKVATFGIRELSAETTMANLTETDSDALKENNFKYQRIEQRDWIARRRKLLADMNQDNSVFEVGNITMRGQMILPGTYLKIYRGPNQVFSGEVYAHTISHNFVPFNSYTLSVQYDRGTDFITRSQNSASPYIYEIEAQGSQGLR